MEELHLLYQENGRVAGVFWDWRQKTLALFFTGTAGLAVAGTWLATNEYGRWISSVFFAGAGLATMCWFMNKRSDNILNDCYEVGAWIEVELLKRYPDVLSGGGATYARLRRGRIFGRVIGWAFAVVATVALTAAVILLFSPPDHGGGQTGLPFLPA